MNRQTLPDTLLCVCNYPSNTGYAWDFIESLYAKIADRLAVRGVRTLVAYPHVERPPASLNGSSAIPVTLDATLRTWRSVVAVCQLIRRERVKAVYLTDRPAWAPAYVALRVAGARHIVVHDHSSGARSRPTGLRRLAKWLLARSPGTTADVIVAVSEYVAKRQLEAGLVPRDRVVRVWNGISLPEPLAHHPRPLHDALSLPANRPIVACACRTAAEKGVPTLLRAFDLVAREWPAHEPRPVLVYMGNGPQFAEVAEARERAHCPEDIVLTGYREDAAALLAGADVCAMPSLWQDALPLAVMQPMSLGLPVVASRVGGIPEMIVDGESGLLVPPGDEGALAASLLRLLQDSGLRERLGSAARERVAQLFTPEQQLDALTGLVWRGFAPGAASRP